MKAYIFIFLIIVSTNSLAQTVNIKEYFLLRENQTDHFTGKYVPIYKDLSDKEIKIPVPPPHSGKSYSDTLIHKKKLTYKTIDIEGYKVYYAIESDDTLNSNAIIGSNHFLSCALIFKNDSVLLAPLFWKKDLYKLKLSDFKYYIPPVVKMSDTIFIIDGEKKLLLYNFNKVTLSLNGEEYNDSLNIQIIERWPEETYSGQVWLSKKFGVLKWIRTTGRIDTKDL